MFKLCCVDFNRVCVGVRPIFNLEFDVNTFELDPTENVQNEFIEIQVYEKHRVVSDELRGASSN